MRAIKLPLRVLTTLQKRSRWEMPRKTCVFVSTKTDCPDGGYTLGFYPASWLPWNENKRPKGAKSERIAR